MDKPIPPENETVPEDGGFDLPKWMPMWMQGAFIVAVAAGALAAVALFVWACRSAH